MIVTYIDYLLSVDFKTAVIPPDKDAKDFADTMRMKYLVWVSLYFARI